MNLFRGLGIIIILLNLNSMTHAQSFPERIISMSIDINAPLDSVWSRWTTDSGRSKFFAPASVMELSTLGLLEIYFSPQSPKGQRGAENNRVMAVQDKQMLSFTWDAPEQFKDIRNQRTMVVIRFYPIEANKTKVTLSQMGWGNGPDWDKTYHYFVKAWSGFVLPNLKYSLEVSPIDWNKIPSGLPPATLLTK